MARQRSAKPCTAVRIRSEPLHPSNNEIYRTFEGFFMIRILVDSIFLYLSLLGWSTWWFFGKNKKICLSFTNAVLILGLLGTLAFVTSLFLPLKESPLLIIFSIGILGNLYILKGKNFLECIKNEGIILIVGLVVSSIFASFAPYILDHFGYYIPTIRIFRDLGTPMGLANLHLVYAQGSWWHYIQAALMYSEEKMIYFQALLYALFFTEHIRDKNYALLVVSVPVLLFIQSPSPDFGGLLIALHLVNNYIKKSEFSLEDLGLGVIMLLIKPTFFWAIPLLLLGINYKNNKLFIIKSAILVMAGIGFFIGKNLWSFGYPVFPISYPEIPLDYSPNKIVLENSKIFGELKTYDMRFSLSEINNWNFFGKLYHWLRIPGIKGVINVVTCLGIFLSMAGIFKSKNKKVKLILFVLLVKVCIVLITSAQYRFILDFLLIITFLLLHNYNKIRYLKIIYWGVLGCFLLFFMFPSSVQKYVPSFRIGNMMQGFSINQIIAPTVYKNPDFHKLRCKDYKFNIPVNYPFVFATPAPALSLNMVRTYLSIGYFPKIVKNERLSFPRCYIINEPLDSHEKKNLTEFLSTFQVVPESNSD